MNKRLPIHTNLIDMIEVGSSAPETVYRTAPGPDFSDFSCSLAVCSGVQVCINKAVQCADHRIMYPIQSTMQIYNTYLIDNVHNTKVGSNLVQINTPSYMAQLAKTGKHGQN